MKKILLFGLAFLLFSCSQDDKEIQSTPLETQTIDPSIGYNSPYYADSSGYMDMGVTPNGYINYKLINSTNLFFTFTPYFGYGTFDFDPNIPEILWPNSPSNSSNIKIFDPSSIYYSPNLITNGKKFGNFIPAEAITLNPNQQQTFIAYNAVPLQYPGMPTINGFNFNYTGSTVRSAERDIVGKMGKLFFIKFDVKNKTIPVANSTVKMNFPHNLLQNGLPNNWANVGYVDSFFGERLVYNKNSREICITIEPNSQYTDTHRFTYQGRNYEVGILTNSTDVVIYLKQVP
ncbi:hypothetical protein HX004_09680 [Myroides sp. 1354]|uniref:hypothetical protein n=1 Tax=unclassified Myroides TaxID=2642485 RepID=UPI0025762FD8|nr:MULTISPECIES: hypothetical protein [unclassified Myroides]MDM1045162.1 hypothetical protein [Myroides sp. R163-1]MDM1056044.1 hypothetical protein [Myroides sp. 1354]MDM1069007.1 hypothetical protein [Myroides sp. 1372]